MMREIEATAKDGVWLHAQDHGPLNASHLPAICLPGLTRNARDFAPLIPHVSHDRRVLALDLRGRGKSGRAGDPASYTPMQEAEDTLRLLDAAGIRRAVFIGTSRGGLVSFLIRAMRPAIMAGLVLNDIGPKLDKAGLLRIRSYLGVPVPLPDWEAAARQVQRTHPGFAGMKDDDWLALAKRIFDEVDGKPALAYDPAIAFTFPSVDDIEAGKVAELWQAYALLGHAMPIAVLRGENSDLLSPETIARMRELTPQLEAVTVTGRGHVPFLDEPESLAAISRVLETADARDS